MASRRPSRPGPPRPVPPSITGRPNDCSVTLPVEIDVMVKVRSKCKPFGSSRTRGGMSLEYPPEKEDTDMLADDRLAGGGVKIEESNLSNGQMPILHDILKKQQKILKSLAYSTSLSMSQQKNSLLSPNRGNHHHVIENFVKLNNFDDFKDEISNDDEIKQTDDTEDTSDNGNDKNQSENQNKIPNSQKYVSEDEIDLFSDITRIDSNISFESDIHDEKEDNKNFKNKERQLKSGKANNNFPIKFNLKDGENSLKLDIEESEMVELFNRRKLKVTKNEQTNRLGEKNKTEMDKDEKFAHKDKNCGR